MATIPRIDLGPHRRAREPPRPSTPSPSHLYKQYSTVQYSTVQYRPVQYSTVQNRPVQYSTVQNRPVQNSTVQYSTVQFVPNVVMFVPYVVWGGGDGFLHGGQAEDLEQVVLHHVPEEQPDRTQCNIHLYTIHIISILCYICNFVTLQFNFIYNNPNVVLNRNYLIIPNSSK